MSLDITPTLAAAGDKVPFALSLDAAQASREDVAVTQAQLSGHMIAHDGRITVDGHVNAHVTAVCARCASEFSSELTAPFHQVYQREDGLTPPDEESDVQVIQGYKLDVTELAVSSLALHMPFRYLCDKDCKGLCTVCGQDLNEGTCSCDSMGEDSPFAVLKTLFNDEKEVDPHGSTQG